MKNVGAFNPHPHNNIINIGTFGRTLWDKSKRSEPGIITKIQGVEYVANLIEYVVIIDVGTVLIINYNKEGSMAYEMYERICIATYSLCDAKPLQ